MAEPEDTRPTPPYAPWQTLMNLLDRMEKEGVPSRVDKTYFGNSMAGGTQAQIKHALRSLGLIDEDGYTDPSLGRLTAAAADRAGLLREILRERYEPLVMMGDDVTPGQFAEVLREDYGLNGATARKAMTFFLSAAAYTGLSVSPHLKLPRAGATGRKSTKPRKKPANGAPPGGQEEQPRPPRSAEHRSVTLPSGAVLALDCSVPLLTLPTDELGNVLALIKKFDALDGVHGEGQET